MCLHRDGVRCGQKVQVSYGASWHMLGSVEPCLHIARKGWVLLGPWHHRTESPGSLSP
jgi:hypothetical protein